MIAAVTGIGWVSTESMGYGRHHKILQSKDGKLPKLTSRMVFGEVSPRFGRLDEYSKLGLAAATFALKDAGQDQWNEKRPAGIVVSSIYGCLATDMEYFEGVIANGGSLASPNLFACTLPNIFLGEAAIRFGLTGPGFAVNEPEPVGMEGLNLALCSISLDENPVMIVGTSDPGCPPLFPYQVEMTIGALFFVIEKRPIDESMSYGGLDMTREGAVLFNGVQIQSLASLFKECLPRCVR